MRILILAGALGEMELFRLIMAHEVASVIDLRVGDYVPSARILRDIYHRPSRTIAHQVLERLIRNWSVQDRTLAVWVSAAQLPQFKIEIGMLRPDAQIKIISEGPC
jgi:hypothetical protein